MSVSNKRWRYVKSYVGQNISKTLQIKRMWQLAVAYARPLIYTIWNFQFQLEMSLLSLPTAYRNELSFG